MGVYQRSALIVVPGQKVSRGTCSNKRIEKEKQFCYRKDNMNCEKARERIYMVATNEI